MKDRRNRSLLLSYTPIDTDIVAGPGSTANAAVLAELAGLIGHEAVHGNVEPNKEAAPLRASKEGGFLLGIFDNSISVIREYRSRITGTDNAPASPLRASDTGQIRISRGPAVYPISSRHPILRPYRCRSLRVRGLPSSSIPPRFSPR